MILDRLAEQLDKHLHKTSFGFWTTDAFQGVRRIIDHGSQTDTKTIALLVDWEKAVVIKELQKIWRRVCQRYLQSSVIDGLNPDIREI